VLAQPAIVTIRSNAARSNASSWWCARSRATRPEGARPWQAYAACLIAQRCLEGAGADDESLWRAACALD
jgi:hypothetical protein